MNKKNNPLFTISAQPITTTSCIDLYGDTELEFDKQLYTQIDFVRLSFKYG